MRYYYLLALLIYPLHAMETKTPITPSSFTLATKSNWQRFNQTLYKRCETLDMDCSTGLAGLIKTLCREEPDGILADAEAVKLANQDYTALKQGRRDTLSDIRLYQTILLLAHLNKRGVSLQLDPTSIIAKAEKLDLNDNLAEDIKIIYLNKTIDADKAITPIRASQIVYWYYMQGYCLVCDEPIKQEGCHITVEGT